MQEGVQAFERLYAESSFAQACGTLQRANTLRAWFYGYFNEFDLEHALNVYVFCLSEHDPKDTDGLLSMWRGYGRNGNGAALIFQTDFLTVNERSPLLFFKVRYESEQERIAWIEARFRECIDILKDHWHVISTDQQLGLVAHQMFSLMEIYSLVSKHKGFSEEKEWRIIYLPKRDTAGVLKEGFDYVIGSRGIEPKLKFKIGPLPTETQGSWNFESILHQIILGPSLSSPLTANTIRRMLDVNNKPGFKQKLRPSGIPLRPLK